MALSGQTNKLADEIQDILENGIETTGLECTDGVPAFGGTGTGEDFDGFTIYSTNLDDDEDENDTENLPCIIFLVEKTPLEYFHDGTAFYTANCYFEVRVDANESKVINSTVHTKKSLVAWLVERLEYVLDTMKLTSVKEGGKVNAASMDTGRHDDDTNFWYFGRTYISINYLEEGDSQ